MKEDSLVRFGKRLKTLRTELNISQEELSFRAGVSKNYISDVECGRRNLTLKMIEKLAKGLKIDMIQFFKEEK